MQSLSRRLTSASSKSSKLSHYFGQYCPDFLRVGKRNSATVAAGPASKTPAHHLCALGSETDGGQCARSPKNSTTNGPKDPSRRAVRPYVNGLPALLDRKSSGCDSGLCAIARSLDRPYLPRRR